MNTHASDPLPLPLEMPQPDGRTLLNGSVWFVDRDGYRVVFRWHEPFYRVALTDEVHLRLVAVSLRQSGLATQEEICRAFGHSVATQTRWEQQYRKHGIDGLVSKKPGGGHRLLDKSQEAFVRRWFQAGCSNRQMAKRLGVDEVTIRRTLKRLGLARVPVTIPRRLSQIEEQAASENQVAETAGAEAGVMETVATPAVTCPATGTAPTVKITTLEEEAASA
jgi:transposase